MLLRAYQKVYKWCKKRGFNPTLHCMDNKTSAKLEQFIAEQNTNVQYTAPGRHCATTEKAVKTYKSCFKSTTASLPPEFPISYWFRLLPHVDVCVNIVCQCRQNPKLPAWGAMGGDFHFESTPIAPPGISMLMYKRPQKRATFGHNLEKAWYIGLCLNNYQTLKAMLPSTGAERISDTIKMKHHAISIPTLTPVDRILEAVYQRDSDIKQQPKRAPMDKLAVINMLREVLLVKRRDPLPPNSVQCAKIRHNATPQRAQLSVTPTVPPAQSPAPLQLTAPAQSPARATGPPSLDQ